MEFLENGEPKILKDLFLYSDTCLIRDISNNILDNLPYVKQFIVDISKDDINTTSQYFTISGEDNNIIDVVLKYRVQNTSISDTLNITFD